MAGNCLATLCEIPTDNNCLATLCEIPTDIIRRYVFKIYIKNNLLIIKNINKQIKMD
jgi:hypothetical protein